VREGPGCAARCWAGGPEGPESGGEGLAEEGHGVGCGRKGRARRVDLRFSRRPIVGCPSASFC
jgi:hypothetical protein